MKILFIKRQKLLYFVFIFLLFFIISMILLSINHHFSFAIELNKTSFFNIPLTTTLDDIAKSDEKVAYLTFDDGPTIKATGKILDILKEENVKATFFVVGKHVKEHPELVKREYDEGHYIANHGYNHNNKLLYKDMESFRNEIISTDLEISKAIGIDGYCSHIFRFPNRIYVTYIY
jgi:peptidoglycan/xylan/chitin deacetylase (PgdA/CDA1 family)